MTDRNEAKEIAGTILKQLGGQKFIIMVGAHALGCQTEENGNTTMTCRFKGSKKANYIKVTLNAMDTYDVKFLKLGRAPKFKITEVAEFDGIYYDQLQKIFTDVTGLYTHL